MYRYANIALDDNKEDCLIPICISIPLLAQNFDDDISFELQCIRACGHYTFTNDIEKFLLYSIKKKNGISITNLLIF